MADGQSRSASVDSSGKIVFHHLHWVEPKQCGMVGALDEAYADAFIVPSTRSGRVHCEETMGIRRIGRIGVASFETPSLRL